MSVCSLSVWLSVSVCLSFACLSVCVFIVCLSKCLCVYLSVSCAGLYHTDFTFIILPTKTTWLIQVYGFYTVCKFGFMGGIVFEMPRNKTLCKPNEAKLIDGSAIRI